MEMQLLFQTISITFPLALSSIIQASDKVSITWRPSPHSYSKSSSSSSSSRPPGALIKRIILEIKPFTSLSTRFWSKTACSPKNVSWMPRMLELLLREQSPVFCRAWRLARGSWVAALGELLTKMTVLLSESFSAGLWLREVELWFRSLLRADALVSSILVDSAPLCRGGWLLFERKSSEYLIHYQLFRYWVLGIIDWSNY